MCRAHHCGTGSNRKTSLRNLKRSLLATMHAVGTPVTTPCPQASARGIGERDLMPGSDGAAEAVLCILTMY